MPDGRFDPELIDLFVGDDALAADHLAIAAQEGQREALILVFRLGGALLTVGVLGTLLMHGGFA